MTIKIFLFFRFLLQLKKKNEELEIQAIISEFNTFSNIIKKKTFLHLPILATFCCLSNSPSCGKCGNFNDSSTSSVAQKFCTLLNWFRLQWERERETEVIRFVCRLVGKEISL